MESLELMALEPVQRISEVVKREQSRLRNFIRPRVPDPRDAEDVLQDVFYELVEANRLLMPIEHVTGWLFRVARNRITGSPKSGNALKPDWRECRHLRRLCGVVYLLSTEGWTD